MILGADLYTQHEHSGFQNNTPGVYVRADSGLSGGVFRNSDGDPSAWVGWAFETQSRRFSLIIGGAVGYRSAPVVPLLLPSVRFELPAGLAGRVTLLPRLGQSGNAGLHFSIEHKL